MAATVQLDKGTLYRGRAIVSYPSVVVTHDAVIAELAKYGITPAQVWFNASELPADWPASAKSDVSPSFTTQIYLEGMWTKPSGMYATSGTKWGIYDYWVQKAAPTVVVPPPQPTCRAVGGTCGANAECCSSLCSSGVCAESGYVPPPAECGTEGTVCDNLTCCEGLNCQEWDGGMLCMQAESPNATPPEPINLNLDAKISDWWYAAGAAAVVGIGWLLWPKLMPKPAVVNPARSFTELSDWAVAELVRIEEQGHGRHKLRSRKGVYQRFLKEMVGAGLAGPNDYLDPNSFLITSWKNIVDVAQLKIDSE